VYKLENASDSEPGDQVYEVGVDEQTEDVARFQRKQ